MARGGKDLGFSGLVLVAVGAGRKRNQKVMW